MMINKMKQTITTDPLSRCISQMRSRIIWLGIPERLEKAKDFDTRVPLGGAQIAEEALFVALLEYSSFDEIIVLATEQDYYSDAKVRLEAFGDSDRVRVVFPEELARLDRTPTVLFQPTTRLREGALCRYHWGNKSWPLVGITHALSGQDAFDSALLSQMQPDLFGESDILICTSEAGQSAWNALESQISTLATSDSENISSRRIATRVIPLGVDTAKFTPGNKLSRRSELSLQGRDILLLYVGRLSPEQKMDPFPLLAAFRMISLEVPKATLILAGDSTGGGAAQIRHMIGLLGIEDRVILFENPSSALKLALYQASDIFISLSDNIQETFGLSLVEAMSCELPIIASNWSGYREIIDDGKTGILVPTTWTDTGNFASKMAGCSSESATHRRLSQQISLDLADITQAVKMLAANALVRTTLGQKGRERALSIYSWQNIITQYDALLKSAMHGSFEEEITANDCGNTCLLYDREAVFGHYSTFRRSADTALRWSLDDILVSAGTQQLPANIGDMVRAVFMRGEIFDRERLSQMLLTMGCERREVESTFNLLVKYGILQSHTSVPSLK